MDNSDNDNDDRTPYDYFSYKVGPEGVDGRYLGAWDHVLLTTSDAIDLVDINHIPHRIDLQDRKRLHEDNDNMQPRQRKKVIRKIDSKYFYSMDTSTSSMMVDRGPDAIQPQLNSRQRRRQRKRYTLPLHVADPRTPAATYTEVFACPDSGSDENIISLALVNELRLDMKPANDKPRCFSIANGNIVQALGQVSVLCRFATGAPSTTPNLECVFQVFSVLAVPIIMGIDFLHETETLSKHTDRLVEQLVAGTQAFRVNSVGAPKRNIMCHFDRVAGYATVDTGSDLDLVSPNFARARSFNVAPAYEQVEFADCSVSTTSGVVIATFSLGREDEAGVFRPHGQTIYLEFYVLDNLNADILVGQDTIDELDVFTQHTESLINSVEVTKLSGVNTIRSVGRLEEKVGRKMQKIKNLFTPPSISPNSATNPTLGMQRENARLEKERGQARNEIANPALDRISVPSLLSHSEIPIPSSPIHSRSKVPQHPVAPPSQTAAATPPSLTSEDTAISKEGGLAIDSTTTTQPSEMRSSPYSTASSTTRDSVGELSMVKDMTVPNIQGGGYICTFAGCTSSPFQTQEILDSHTDVHRNPQPHIILAGATVGESMERV